MCSKHKNVWSHLKETKYKQLNDDADYHIHDDNTNSQSIKLRIDNSGNFKLI